MENSVELNRQQQLVFNTMTGGQWWTLADLSYLTGEPEASVSARLRDFRKPQFGGHTVARRRRLPGQFEYRLEVRVV